MNKYQEIVKAAAKVFKAKGYHAATVQDIASEVGMLKGSLYYHIQSKEQLLTEVIICAVNVLNEGLSKVVDSDLPAEEKLKKAILFHLQAYLGSEELPVYYKERTNLPPGPREKLNAAIKEYEDMWMKILQEGAGTSFRADLPARIMLQSLFGMYNWAHRWYRHDGPLSTLEMGEIFCKLSLDGVRKRD